MSIGFIFWVVFLIWVILGFWMGTVGSNLILFILLFLLGWKVFGFPIQG